MLKMIDFTIVFYHYQYYEDTYNIYCLVHTSAGTEPMNMRSYEIKNSYRLYTRDPGALPLCLVTWFLPASKSHVATSYITEVMPNPKFDISRPKYPW